MKERVVDIYGVKATVRCHGVSYTMPWRRHVGNLGNRWMAAGAAFACAAASFLPLVLWAALKPKPWGLAAIFFWTLASGWFLWSNGFTVLFTVMTWSTWTKWGRAWIWVGRSMMVSLQLRGEESWVSMTRLTSIRKFSTLPDGDDRQNPATPARLLAELDNNVKRIIGDYPIALVDAMVGELALTVRRLRR